MAGPARATFMKLAVAILPVLQVLARHNGDDGAMASRSLGVCHSVEITTGTYENPKDTVFKVATKPVDDFKPRDEINIVIVDAVSGKVVKFKHFDLHNGTGPLVEFMAGGKPSDVYLIGIAYCDAPPGALMAMLRSMGAKVTPSTGYALIGTKYGEALGEVEGQGQTIKATLPCHKKFEGMGGEGGEGGEKDLDKMVGVESGGTYDINRTLFFVKGKLSGDASSTGINIMVLDSDGEIVSQNVYDLLHNRTKANKELLEALDDIEEDQSMLLGVHGTGMELTTGEVRDALVKLGADRETLDQIQPHEGYTLISGSGLGASEDNNWHAISFAKIGGEGGEGGEGGKSGKGKGDSSAAAGVFPSFLLTSLAAGMLASAQNA